MISIILASSLLTLQDINPEQLNKSISIRGFVHQMPTGEWVLSTMPNIRSCCSGSKHPKLIIKGNVEASPSKAITLEGELVLEDGQYCILIGKLK